MADLDNCSKWVKFDQFSPKILFLCLCLFMLQKRIFPLLSHLFLIPLLPVFLTSPLLLFLPLFSFPPASPRQLPRRMGEEGAGWRRDGWPLRQLIGNSLIYGQELPRPNGFISFCRHMMSQPRSPQQRLPLCCGFARWWPERREWIEIGNEMGGHRNFGVGLDLFAIAEVMYELWGKRVMFAERLLN